MGTRASTDRSVSFDADVTKAAPVHKILGVRLPQRSVSRFWDITISNGLIYSIEPHTAESLATRDCPGVLDASGRLLAPSLCHAHIHLDKCFLLQDSKYADLEIISGDFSEAMRLTGQAKARFREDDLLRRGRQLIEESISFGVTSMRAFVEVDGQVNFRCLHAGLQLKSEFVERCSIQICAFAQLPLFSGEDGGEEIRVLMIEAAQTEGVDVVGSTPYVETEVSKCKQNMRWISSLAIANDKMLDLHMDYHLDDQKEPMIWSALQTIKERGWNERGGKGICMGHCTRFTLFESDEWERLRDECRSLPVSFVGLPTSDLFIIRPAPGARGTLPITALIRDFDLNAAIAVNNVGNAFTPHGSCDPLAVACLGVGVYHAVTKADAELLYECVSIRAKTLIGEEQTASGSLELSVGDPADFVIFDRDDHGWRNRKSIAEAVYDAGNSRQTIRRGKITNP
ncbi:cytosine deaminase protein-like protein [Pseudovirgaria hyperparasitica]|uniref:Cytosine deaminase protein-like protein n=1 Tax=Pseudovirgaria hyperparasitica TaxID=470096 RepID=A0A6A6W4F4_9PEZI|nr:cytosine deaminase protein-like protein [Pseudovirgaria hyperparasitica]KAF2757808.1 cytosine deaminase protein-like protein [Pseudovirgaria hyperparasitica]